MAVITYSYRKKQNCDKNLIIINLLNNLFDFSSKQGKPLKKVNKIIIIYSCLLSSKIVQKMFNNYYKSNVLYN